MDDYFRHAKEELFPKMKASAMSITIFHSEPDPKLCMELGAAILFDKPIILVVPDPDRQIPANLRRIASVIVVGNPLDPETQQRMQDAITAVLDNDVRVNRGKDENERRG
jgi:hypothetical protein